MAFEVNVFPLFPSTIYTVRLNNSFNKEIDRFNNTAYDVNVSGVLISKEKRILDKIPKVKKGLLDQFKSIVKDNIKCKNDFIISTSWITKTEKGSYIQSHSHKNSFYSGIYYYNEYDAQSGMVEFETPLWNHSDFYLYPKEFNLLNMTSFKLKPQSNLLVFFPSYLQHQVSRHNDNKSRYSLSFNIIPIGKYGKDDSFYKTSWVNG